MTDSNDKCLKDISKDVKDNKDIQKLIADTAEADTATDHKTLKNPGVPVPESEEGGLEK